MGTYAEGEEEWRKRLALTGQWQTPPTPPMFASVSTADPLSQSRTSVPVHEGTANPQPKAADVDRYAAALQEAYRRGAQAAAVKATTASGERPGDGEKPVSTSASCPELPKPTQTGKILPLPIVPNPLLYLSSQSVEMPPPPPLPQPQEQPPAALQATQPPVQAIPAPTPLAPSPPAEAAMTSTSATSSVQFPYVTPISSPNSHQQLTTQAPFGQPRPPFPQPQLPVAVNATAGAPHPAAHPLQPPPQPLLVKPPSYPLRAMSMPNMGFNLEEEKRQKRLARNRASARLRRMRKKNLVEAYEVEVGILESTVQALKVHQWGLQDEPRALMEALSLDRGQQPLSAEERRQAAVDILDQQLEFVGMLQDGLLEQYVLVQLTRDTGELSDLKEALQLSPEQCARIADSAVGWDDEWRALQTVKSSLLAMKNSTWLLDDGGNSIVDGFLSILQKSQISKLLLWSDHNGEAIDDLDFVNASFDSNPAGCPVFQFGVSNNPDTLLEPSPGNGEAL